ncbi:MAG: NAD-dependent deacylase [Bacteroidota bacterium]|nr:NAD-dependent deacylase [Bacteroidota bacterium]
MKKIAILTGSGISAESGLKTFRDSGGLWEEYRIEEVATYEAWEKNPEMVLDFYNQRRKQALAAKPNIAHLALVQLEKKYIVNIITQNIDDLHERAGSTNVLHLHGEITKARSTSNPNLIYDIDGRDLKLGDKCELGSQLRPHIVWFGEAVPEIENAARMVNDADIFIIIGTSMNVYPASGLINYVKNGADIYSVDPGIQAIEHNLPIIYIKENAGTGVPKLVDKLLSE